MATSGAGYDYYYVEPPPQRLLCKICKSPCRQAQVSQDLVYCKCCVPESCVAGVKSSVSVSCFRYLPYSGFISLGADFPEYTFEYSSTFACGRSISIIPLLV